MIESTATTEQQTSVPIPSIRDGLLDKDQLAAEFGRTKRTIDRWLAVRDAPPHIRIAGKIYFRREALLRWLESKETPSTPKRGRPKGYRRSERKRSQRG